MPVVTRRQTGKLPSSSRNADASKTDKKRGKNEGSPQEEGPVGGEDDSKDTNEEHGTVGVYDEKSVGMEHDDNESGQCPNVVHERKQP